MSVRIRNCFFLFAVIGGTVLWSAQQAVAQTYSTVHNFTAGVNADAPYPYGGLVLSGNTLYGTAYQGGNSGEGTIYQVNTDGTGFAVLYNFTAIVGTNYTNSDGALPVAGLVLAGNTLYGTALEGGSAGNGTIFAINTDGTGFTNLYSFTGITSFTNGDGANPMAALAESGGVLYGTAQNAGRFGLGTVFKINTNGTDFATLFSFEGGQTGENPVSGVIVSGDLLYGTTEAGGTDVYGAVFSLSTAGYNFNNVYSFTNGDDGSTPVGGVILSGNTLYGTASQGGNLGYGTVFSVQTDGTGISEPYTFTGADDGANPAAGLVLSGDTLYGTTTNSESGFGTVFEVNTDNSGFQTLYSFTGGSDGYDPYASLVFSDGVLYGTTINGQTPDNATVYAVTPADMGFSTVNTYSGGGDGSLPQAGLTASGGVLYGTASSGGLGLGTLFSFNASGGGYTNFYTFTSYYSDGTAPEGPLTLSGGVLYGTAVQGGTGGNGVVFSVNPNGTGFMPLHSFNSAVDGNSALGTLVVSSNVVYGVTASEANLPAGQVYGTVYRVGVNSMNFTNLHLFSDVMGEAMTNGDGADPQAGLILSGGTLYGTACFGGTGASGTIFALSVSGSIFTNMHSFTARGFDYTNSDGAVPQGLLLLSGSTLFGTAAYGGTAGYGTIFAIGTNGSGFTNLYNFTGGSDGANPVDGLVQSGDTFYGTTSAGGDNGNGTIFAIGTNGSGLTVLHAFNAYAIDDGNDSTASLVLVGNTLYGTAQDGGYWSAGTVFSFALGAVAAPSPTLTIVRSGTNVVLTWPGTVEGFTLQSTPKLSPASWNTVNPGPVIVNGQNTVTNPASAPQLFYRLDQ